MELLPSVGSRAKQGKSNVTSLSSSKMMLKKLSQLGQPFATPHKSARNKDAPTHSLTTRETHLNRTGPTEQSSQLAGHGSPESANPFSMTLSKAGLTSKTFEQPQSASKRPTRHIKMLQDKRMKLVSAAKSQPAYFKIECHDKLFPMRFKTLDQSCRITIYTAFNSIPSLESYSTIHFQVRSFFLEKDPSIPDIRFVGLMIEVDQVWSHFIGCAFKGTFHNYRRAPEILPATQIKQDGSEPADNKQIGDVKHHHKLTNEDYEEYQALHLDFPESSHRSPRNDPRHRRAESSDLQEERFDPHLAQPHHREQLPQLQAAVP